MNQLIYVNIFLGLLLLISGELVVGSCCGGSVGGDVIGFSR